MGDSRFEYTFPKPTDRIMLIRENGTGQPANLYQVSQILAAIIGGGGGGGPVDLNNAHLTGSTTVEQISPVESAMGGMVIDVTKALNALSLDDNTTLTFSGVPAAGAVFGIQITGGSVPRTVTIPSSYSVDQNSTITSFILPANAVVYLSWRYTGSEYHLRGEPLPPPRAQTNAQIASYTLTLLDEGKVVQITSESANDLTVPPNATAAFPIGAQIVIRQGGAGQMTVVAGDGVTVDSNDGALKLAGQYASAVLTKKGPDVWNLDGRIVE